MNAMKSQFCSLTSFVGIPHDLTYKEDNEQLMMSARKGLLNDHLIVCETLHRYVFKEKFIGEEFHQSMCPFHLLSLICRCTKHHNVVPMLLSKSPFSSLFKRELRKKMTLWDATGTDTQGVTTLPDAVTRVPPSLLLRNSMLPVEPKYSVYYNVVMEQLKRITEIRESEVAEVDQMPDEDVSMLLKACLDANEERRWEMSTKKKGVLLCHVLKVIREAGVPVDHPYVYEDDDQNYLVCSIKRVNVFKR